LDNHGKAMVPIDGWSNHDPFSMEWKTKRVADWDVDEGVALRFDGADSPNVKAAKTTFPYIFTKEDWDAAKENGENSLAYWTQTRGIHPPEGLLAAVLNETALANADIDERLMFTGNRTLVAFLDPAWIKDKPIVSFAECGEIEGGMVGLQFIDQEEIVILSGDDSPEPDLQVAKGFVDKCKVRGIVPMHAGVDATGSGRGTYAFVCTI